MKTWTLVSFAWLVLGVFARALETPQFLNLTTYRSASGRFALEVDPTDPFGRGESQCRLSDNGHEVWKKSLSFTFSKARVTEDGVVVGYGYTEGLSGMARGGGEQGHGDLRLAILDAKGDFRLDEKQPRTWSPIPDAPPVPMGGETFLHPGHDRFAVQIYDGNAGYWQAYELSTGKRGVRFDYKAEGAAADAARYVLKAQPVAGTPLTLVQWWCYADNPSKCGALFTLIDLAGHQVWQLPRLDDYSIPGDEKAQSQLTGRIQDKGAILDTDQPGMFELWFVRDKQRVIHTVERDGEGWKVKEIGRQPYPPPEKKLVTPKPPEKPLAVLGTFTLADQPAAKAVGGSTWSFDGRGNIGQLDWGEKGTELVLLDPDGKRLTGVPLKGLGDGTIHAAWVQGDRWIVTSSDAETNKSRAWAVDTKKKTQALLADFSCPRIKSLAGARDGGFLALATEDGQSMMTDYLIAFDDKGRRRWSKKEYLGDGPEALFSPESVAVTTRSEVAVLDVIRHTVQLFDLKGVYLRTIDLEKAWGRKPEYPTEITPDHDGGFMVKDFSAPKPFVWMKADGTVRAEFHPKYADGRNADPIRGVRIAPDGQAWSRDGVSIFSLSTEGVASRTIGAVPDPDSLQDLRMVAVDAAGHLFAVDGRTGAVHVFDAEGHKLRISKPEKKDFGQELSPKIVVSPEGTLYLSGLGREGAIEFTPEGHRVGKLFAHRGDAIREDWFPRGGGRGRLEFNFAGAELVNAEGTAIRKIERRADRQWLGSPNSAAVAADGSFAIASSGNGPGYSLDFYTSEGDAVADAFADGWLDVLGFNGRHAVVEFENGDALWLYDRKGQPVQRVTPAPKVAKGDWKAFLTREGRELWVLDTEARKVTRYAMPEGEGEK
jgi:hypothetical protein